MPEVPEWMPAGQGDLEDAADRREMPIRESSVGVSGQLRTWYESGNRAVTLLQGFSGIGKSWTASNFAAALNARTVFTSIPEGCLGSFDVLIEIADEFEHYGDTKMTARPDGDLLKGLVDTLREPGLLVIDNFQNLLSSDAIPPSDIFNTLRRVSIRNERGRVLLLTNQALAEGDWEDDIPILTFPTPAAGEAQAVLDSLLSANEVTAAVPSTLRSEVAKWLGFNPRAMQILSACLRFDSLDQLIALEPSAWELKDQFLSVQLVERLERRIVSHLLTKLDASSQVLLDNLSVLRRPFSKAAIERQSSMVADCRAAKTRLISLFVMSLDPRGRYSINPVARQVTRHRVETAGPARRRAHRFAADYYSRHFRAQGESGAFHGQEFVEARYHLLALNALNEFDGLAAKFRKRQLRHLERAALAIPNDQERLTELLVTLAALLADSTTGFPRLRYILARLCVQRARPGDDILGLNQLRIATAESNEEGIWMLYLRLLSEVEGAAPVARAAQIARGRLSVVSALHIYFIAAQIIARSGDLNGAIELVGECLTLVPTENVKEGTYAFQLMEALLLRAGRYEEAMTLMEQFRSKIKADNPMYNRIVEAIAFPALARRDSARLKSLMDSIPLGPRPTNQKILCDALLSECAGNFPEAAEKLALADQDYLAARAQLVFCYLVSGEFDKAEESLGYRAEGRTNAWLEAVVHLKCGRDALAIECLQKVMGRLVSDDEADDPYLWVRVWDRIPPEGGDYPAFYYPRLPAALTGLASDLVRLESEETALRGVSLRNGRVSLRDTQDLDTLPPQGDLDAVMAGGVTPPVVVNLYNLLAGTASGNFQNVEGDIVSDTYNVNQAGAVGRDAAASNFIQLSASSNFESLDLAQLAAELRRFTDQLRTLSLNEEQAADVEILVGAQVAAESGNRDGTRSRLSRVSSWALGAATAVGTSLVAVAIKSATGL